MSITVSISNNSYENMTQTELEKVCGKKTLKTNMINTFEVDGVTIVAPTTSRADYVCRFQTEHRAEQIVAKMKTAERLKATLAKRQAKK